MQAGRELYNALEDSALFVARQRVAALEDPEGRQGIETAGQPPELMAVPLEAALERTGEAVESAVQALGHASRARREPASQPGAAGSWPAGQSRASRVSAVDAIWAASSRDVLNRPETGVQACVNCGLPLSSTARFCRRCGANQVQA